MDTVACEQYPMGSREQFRGTSNFGLFLLSLSPVRVLAGPRFAKETSGWLSEAQEFASTTGDPCTAIPTGPYSGRWLLCDSDCSVYPKSAWFLGGNLPQFTA